MYTCECSLMHLQTNVILMYINVKHTRHVCMSWHLQYVRHHHEAYNITCVLRLNIMNMSCFVCEWAVALGRPIYIRKTFIWMKKIRLRLPSLNSHFLVAECLILNGLYLIWILCWMSPNLRSSLSPASYSGLKESFTRVLNVTIDQWDILIFTWSPCHPGSPTVIYLTQAFSFCRSRRLIFSSHLLLSHVT